MNLITSQVDVQNKPTGQAANIVMNDLAGKIMAHLIDESPWLVCLNSFQTRQSVTNATTRLIRTAGIASFAELLPALTAMNDLVKQTRINMGIWRGLHPGEVYKNDEPKQVLIDERLLIALLDVCNFPIGAVPEKKDSNPQVLS